MLPSSYKFRLPGPHLAHREEIDVRGSYGVHEIVAAALGSVAFIAIIVVCIAIGALEGAK